MDRMISGVCLTCRVILRWTAHITPLSEAHCPCCGDQLKRICSTSVLFALLPMVLEVPSLNRIGTCSWCPTHRRPQLRLVVSNPEET